MLFLIVFTAIVIFGLCATKGNSRKAFIGFILALLYIPFGVIFGLTKRYK